MLKSIKSILYGGLAVSFLITSLPSPETFAWGLTLPAPGVMVPLSPLIEAPILKGIKIHPDNPFRFDFILDQGDSSVIARNAVTKQSQQEQLKTEATRLIKYFLASLTVPEKDLWVNLSPYEKDRIVPRAFGLTEMGRDLLAEDYMLKQITASLIYPEGETGKKFWQRIYAEAEKRFGTTNIPVNTFNKVWIVPQKAVVYENAKAGTAYVVEAKLKVMLEQDYLSLQKHQQNVDTNQLGSDIVRQIVIPELTHEVNYGANFAQLRQVYNSLILATWYKKKIKDSILQQVYADRNKIKGLSSLNSSVGDPQYIYQQYLKAFKKGVFNYIKEDIDPATHQSVPRKYFSGGWTALGTRSLMQMANESQAMVAIHNSGSDRVMVLDVKLDEERSPNRSIGNNTRQGILPDHTAILITLDSNGVIEHLIGTAAHRGFRLQFCGGVARRMLLAHANGGLPINGISDIDVRLLPKSPSLDPIIQMQLWKSDVEREYPGMGIDVLGLGNQDSETENSQLQMSSFMNIDILRIEKKDGKWYVSDGVGGRGLSDLQHHLIRAINPNHPTMDMAWRYARLRAEYSEFRVDQETEDSINKYVIKYSLAERQIKVSFKRGQFEFSPQRFVILGHALRVIMHAKDLREVKGLLRNIGDPQDNILALNESAINFDEAIEIERENRANGRVSKESDFDGVFNLDQKTAESYATQSTSQDFVASVRRILIERYKGSLLEEMDQEGLPFDRFVENELLYINHEPLLNRIELLSEIPFLFDVLSTNQISQGMIDRIAFYFQGDFENHLSINMSNIVASINAGRYSNLLDYYFKAFKNNAMVTLPTFDPKEGILTLLINEFPRGTNIGFVKLADAIDRAQIVAHQHKNFGGIDLTSDKAMSIQNNGMGIQFHLDPTQLAALENASGFLPVIISTRQTNLQQFLGISTSANPA